MPDPSEERPFSGLVVVGSPAGGVEALSELLSQLPRDFPTPVVLARHPDPERENNLEEILERRSALPVRIVTGREPLEAGVVYVVPADRPVDITDPHIDLPADSHRSLAVTCHPGRGTRVEVAVPLKGGG